MRGDALRQNARHPSPGAAMSRSPREAICGSLWVTKPVFQVLGTPVSLTCQKMALLDHPGPICSKSHREVTTTSGRRAKSSSHGRGKSKGIPLLLSMCCCRGLSSCRGSQSPRNTQPCFAQLAVCVCEAPLPVGTTLVPCNAVKRNLASAIPKEAAWQHSLVSAANGQFCLWLRRLGTAGRNHGWRALVLNMRNPRIWLSCRCALVASAPNPSLQFHMIGPWQPSAAAQ